MNGRMHLVVDGVVVGALRDEELDDGSVAGDDRKVERSVALLVLLIEKAGLGFQDLKIDQTKNWKVVIYSFYFYISSISKDTC